MKYFFLLFSCLFFWQCAKPIAAFVQKADTNLVVPAKVYFENTSENVSSYSWEIDGKPHSSDKHLEHTFYDSGKHTVVLLAKEGNKTTRKESQIYVEAPSYCTVLIKTSLGDLVVELDEKTPGHLKNFSELVESGFYNGIFFHRIIDDFMVQGGGNENRNSGKRLADPPTVPHEINNELLHYKGALAAARMPDDMNPEKASNGSQFYIVDGRSLDADKMEKIQAEKIFDYSAEQIEKYIALGGAPQLDGEYTVFGFLISGFDVLDEMATTDTDKYDKPLEDIIIIEARMLN